MKIPYHYRVKIFAATFGALVWLAVLWVLDLSVGQKALWCSLGVVVGCLLATRWWRRMARQVDARRTLITYFSDTPLYALLVVVFLLAQLPRAPFKVAFFTLRHPTFVQVVLLVLATAAFAYNVSILVLIRAYEKAHGPLRVKELHARSVTGLEGMLGRIGTVTHRCDPYGKVRIRSEVWDAVSIDGETIPSGAEVVVRDVEGLSVIVQKREDGTRGLRTSLEELRPDALSQGGGVVRYASEFSG